MRESLRVGIVGATGGWATESHVPALRKLPGYELVAVASSNQATADAAAKACGAKAAYASGADLIRDPDVDIVTVAVRVPQHRDLVLAALAAGKHVYCEWPLGRNVAEAQQMVTAARASGVHTVIGLQTRANPAARQARELIASGRLGRILSARVYSSTAGFGPDVPDPYMYLEVPENGANLVAIQGAHTLDLAIFLLGPFIDATALASRQYPNIAVGKDRLQRARTTFDHLLLQGRIGSGISLSAEVAGGRPSEHSAFRLEVTGEKGNLVLEGGAPRGFQSGRLRLLIDGRPQPVDEGDTGGMPDAAENVSGLYASLRHDIARGTNTAPDFDHAVRLTRLIEDLLSSSQDGTRKSAAHWPG